MPLCLKTLTWNGTECFICWHYEFGAKFTVPKCIFFLFLFFFWSKNCVLKLPPNVMYF